jgi:hypothetical protein
MCSGIAIARQASRRTIRTRILAVAFELLRSAELTRDWILPWSLQRIRGRTCLEYTRGHSDEPDSGRGSKSRQLTQAYSTDTPGNVEGRNAA